MNKSTITITSKDPAVKGLLDAMTKLPGVEDITGTHNEHCIVHNHMATIVVKVDEVGHIESIKKILDAYARGKVKWSLCIDHVSDEGGVYTRLTASFDVKKMTLDGIRKAFILKRVELQT